MLARRLKMRNQPVDRAGRVLPGGGFLSARCRATVVAETWPPPPIWLKRQLVINLLTTRYFWVIWSALGWGVGLAAHGLAVFGKIPFLNGDWERKKYLGRSL